jgi:pimeloyl-ACP methyl ester carboxylesterase
MSGTMNGLFVSGWAATTGLYLAGLPEGWEALELPSFRTTRGELSTYRRWLGAEIARRPTPVALAGHSMGGALALLAAVDQPELVEKLILLSPAGLPLSKPMWASTATFAGQVARRCYPAGELWRAVARMATAPRAALRLARSVHDLDLTPELERIRAHRIPCTVVGSVSDELTTPAHCRRLAALLDATYREVDASEGHIWVITEPARLTDELARSS